MKKLFPNGRRGTSEYRSVFHIPLGVWLSYLLAVSMLFTGLSLAKYTSLADGSDRAVVAMFDVAVSEQAVSGSPMVLSKGEMTCTGTYSFKVTNNSEVTIRYNINISGLPEGVTVSFDDGSTADSFRTLEMGASRSHTLTFSAKDATSAVAGAKVSLSLHAEQVD